MFKKIIAERKKQCFMHAVQSIGKRIHTSLQGDRFKYIQLLTYKGIQTAETIEIKSVGRKFLIPFPTNEGVMAFQEELRSPVQSVESIFRKANVHHKGLNYFNGRGYLNDVTPRRCRILIDFLNGVYMKKKDVVLGLDMHDTHSSLDTYISLSEIDFSKRTDIYWTWLGMRYDREKRLSQEKYPIITSNLEPTQEEQDDYADYHYLYRSLLNGSLGKGGVNFYYGLGGVGFRALKDIDSD